MSIYCKGCKKTKDNEDFGIKNNGTQYKTCDTCINNKKQSEVKQAICKDKTFLEYYVNLPIFKFENKQDNDIRLDSIVVLDHNVEFHNNMVFRSDGETWEYKEFAKLDPIEYYEGTDPEMEYMPDEYVAPVLVKINGVTYRASMLMWFPLTDVADAIKWKRHETNTSIYPIHIEKDKGPFTEAVNAIGAGSKNWQALLPTLTDITMKEIKERSIMIN